MTRADDIYEVLEQAKLDMWNAVSRMTKEACKNDQRS